MQAEENADRAYTVAVEGFKGQKIPQMPVNENLLDDICFHKSIQDFLQ